MGSGARVCRPVAYAGGTLMSIIVLPSFSCPVLFLFTLTLLRRSISLYSPETPLNRYSEHIRGFMPRLEHCRRSLDRLSLQPHRSPRHLSRAPSTCASRGLRWPCVRKKRSGDAGRVSRARQKAHAAEHSAGGGRKAYLYRAVGATR